MASYFNQFRGDFQHFCNYLEREILNGSSSASLEEKRQMTINGVNCCIQVYERYSYLGKNRVSLSVTILEYAGEIHLTAVSSGGSQAMFFKINTIGEENFLEKLKEAVISYYGQG